MKKAISVVATVLLLVSCQQEAPPAPNNTTTQSSTCNPEETALLGKWFLREIQQFFNDTFFPPSQAYYNNPSYYVEFQSALDNSAGMQQNFPSAKTCVWSPFGSANNGSWRCSGDTLKVPASAPSHRVTYVDTDSLVLDYGLSADSSDFSRWILHK